MNYYLGVDGGGTKTKFMISDEQGRILAQSTQTNSHYLQCGFDGITQVMAKGLKECLKKCGLHEQDISSAFIACAGYGDIEKDCAPIEEAVHKAYKSFPYRIGNDTDNAIAGSLGGKCGIHIIAGTGSIGLGINEKHNTLRCGGWHHSFGGDEGSAYWIACQLILHFTRQSDGREDKTLLYEYMKKEYQLKEDSDILDLCVVQWGFDRTRIAGMAKSVYELAKRNDPIALQIFKEAAKELSDIILAIYHKLPFSDPIINVSYSGGVFQSGPFILDSLREELSRYPKLKLTAPLLSPEAGCILLAMRENHQAITRDILQNLSGKDFCCS